MQHGQALAHRHDRAQKHGRAGGDQEQRPEAVREMVGGVGREDAAREQHQQDLELAPPVRQQRHHGGRADAHPAPDREDDGDLHGPESPPLQPNRPEGQRDAEHHEMGEIEGG